MKIHHIGYAVPDVVKALSAFLQLGYVQESAITDDLSRNVRIVFLNYGSWRIELVAPLSDQSPVTKLLKREGATPYHICYEVENIEEAVKTLRKSGFFPLEKVPKEAPAIPGNSVQFLTSLSVGLIELVAKIKSKGEK